MKKVFIILILTALLLVGCEASNENSLPSGTDGSAVTDTEHSKQEEVSQEAESEATDEVSLPPEVSDSDYMCFVDFGLYITFEETVSRCEDIAIGKLIYAHSAYEEVIYAFSISRWIYGERTDEIIFLYEWRAYFSGDGFSYKGGEMPFEQDKEYLLVLYSEEKENSDHTHFYLYNKTYIPCEDVSLSTMYDDDMKNHTEKPELFSGDTGKDALDALIEYAVSLKQGTITVTQTYPEERTFTLSAEDTDFVMDLWDGEWLVDITKTACDFEFELDGNIIKYSNEAGLFNDYENERHMILTDEQKDAVNKMLGIE